MFCQYCGSQIRDTARFCPSCGQLVKAAAPPPVAPPYVPPAVPPAAVSSRRAFRPGRRVMGCGLALLGVLLLAVVALAAAYFILGLHRRDQMTHILPAEGVTYYATISPSLRQLPALRRIVSAAGDRAAFAPLAPIVEALPSSDANFDFDLREDVLSWVGREASVALVEVEQPEGWTFDEVVIAAVSRNDERALAFAAKLLDGMGDAVSTTPVVYDGMTFQKVSIDDGDTWAYGIVADQLVLATDPGAMQRIIDTVNGNSDSLAGNDAFRDAVDALPGNRLGYAYIPFDDVDSGTPIVEALRGAALAYGLTGGGVRFDYALKMDRGLLTSEQIEALEGDPIENKMATYTPDDAIIYVSGRGLSDTILSLGHEGEGFLDDIDSEFGIDFYDDYLAHFPGEFALVAIDDADSILGEGFGILLLGEVDDHAAAASDFASSLQDIAASEDLDYDELEQNETTIFLAGESGSDLAVGAGVGAEHGFIGLSRASLQDAARIGDDNLAASDAFRETMKVLPDGVLYVYIDGRRGRQFAEDVLGEDLDADTMVGEVVRDIRGVGISVRPIDRDGVIKGMLFTAVEE